MVSFQLFKINEKFNLKRLQDEDIIKTAKVSKDDPQTLRVLLDSLKKSYRNLNFKPLKYDFAMKMSMDEYVQFQDNQTLWVKREKDIIKHNQFLLVGKAEKKIEKLLMIYLRDIADLTPVVFQRKQLWNMWKNLKKLIVLGNQAALSSPDSAIQEIRDTIFKFQYTPGRPGYPKYPLKPACKVDVDQQFLSDINNYLII